MSLVNSTSKLPITVLIPTLNAADHLPDLLEGVLPHVEDVQILDSRSTDATVSIALAHDITILQRPFTTFGEHFQWMIAHMPVRTEWIFLMAQDERFTGSLVREMAQLFERDPEFEGYTVRWRLWFMGRPLSVIVDNLRLFRRGAVTISDVLCNEKLILQGKEGRLVGVLEHKDSLSLHEWYEKQNLYSTLEAIAKYAGKGEFSVSPKLFGTRLERRMFLKKTFFYLPLRYQAIFLYNFVWKGAWRDGRNGALWSKLRTDVYKMREYKYREMKTTGRVPSLPKARHGDFDRRILGSELQRRLLPETCSPQASSSGAAIELTAQASLRG